MDTGICLKAPLTTDLRNLNVARRRAATPDSGSPGHTTQIRSEG
jgi:hypothetical protein